MKEVLEDLARSGLSANDAKKLKLKLLSAEQTGKLTGGRHKVLSYKIPYPDPSGKLTDFYRLRFLEPVKQPFSKKLIRYQQPSGTAPRLYFPPLMDWEGIGEDTEERIVITEGEKKAATTCKSGVPCIGLGGVWSFRSKKHRQNLIEDFDLIKWEERPVWLVFDSDMNTNQNILQAIRKLADELTALGAQVFIGSVPAPPVPAGEVAKAGLDDYIVDGGDVDDINVVAYEESAMLWALNDEVAYIEEHGAFYEFSTRKMWNETKLVNAVLATRQHVAFTASGDMKKVSTAKEWISWPLRRTHRGLKYAPGEPQITEDNYLNTWTGWGVEPKRGNIKPWNDLLDFIFSEDKKFKKWFIQWLAYPIQHPGTKLNSCVLLHSNAHGTGKSFIGYIMGRVYGESNFVKIGQEHLHASHNGWMAGKQFIMGEEVTASDKRREAAKLRDLITQESVLINEKFQPHYNLRDCTNWFFTSNYADALFIETNDRRVAVHEITAKPKPMSFYDRIDHWINHEDGASHLLYHLMNEVSLEGFNPKAHAMMTSAKMDMIDLSRSDLDNFAHQLYSDPDSTLTVNGVPIERAMFTSKELIFLYDPDGMKRTTEKALGGALRRAGFPAQRQGYMGNGQRVRLWAIRDPHKWNRKETRLWAKEYERSRSPLDKANAEKKTEKFKVIKGGKGK